MSTVSVDPRIRARRVEVARDAGRRRLRRLSVLGVVLGIVAIGVAVTFSPALDVEHIAVAGGTGHYRRAALLDAAGVAKGDPLPWLDTGDAERGLEALPWVDEATVDRTWSGSVSISVTERVAVAAVAAADETWFLVDGTGRLLEALDADPTDVPLIDGVADGQPGDTLDRSGIDAATVAAGVPSGLRADIATITGSGSDLAIALRSGGAIVMGGADDAAAKLSAAAAVLATVSPGCVEQLDVSVASAPALISVPGCT